MCVLMDVVSTSGRRFSTHRSSAALLNGSGSIAAASSNTAQIDGCLAPLNSCLHWPRSAAGRPQPTRRDRRPAMRWPQIQRGP